MTKTVTALFGHLIIGIYLFFGAWTLEFVPVHLFVFWRLCNSMSGLHPREPYRI